MKTILAFVFVSVAAWGAAALPCTGIAAVHHDGQTFVTCAEPYTGSASANMRYLIYRSTSGPILDLASATLIATNFNNGGQFTDSRISPTLYTFVQATRQDSTRRMAIITAGGSSSGGAQLAPFTQLAVYTAQTNETAYYAVITHDVSGTLTDSVLSAGSNSLSNGVVETAVPTKPILQALSTDPARYQSSPSTKITQGPGGAGCLRDHGSGGGASTWGDLWGLWQPAYQDGVQSMFSAYQSTGCGVSGQGTSDIVLTPQDMVWSASGTQGFETYWTGYQDGTYFQPYTQKRLDAIVSWGQSYYGIDPNRFYYWGDSMGTIGGLDWALRKSPNPFAIVVLASPFPHGLNDEYVDITQSTATPKNSATTGVTLPDGTPLGLSDGHVATGGYSDTVAWLQAQPCSTNLPPVVWGAGRTDNTIRYDGSTKVGPAWQGHVDFLNALKTCRWGYAFNWGNGNHGEGLTDANVVISQYINSYQKNVSYPAFTNFSMDGNSGDGTYNPAGGGSVSNGDLTGCINCGWTWSGVSDTPVSWAVSLSNSQVASAAATTDITIRNAQSFHPAVGALIRWTTSAGNTGNIEVDAAGLVTATGVPIPVGGITITFVPDTGSGTRLPLNTWTKLGSGGFPQTVVGYDAITWDAINKSVCVFGNYRTRGVTSEIQDAMECFNYERNYTTVVSQGGGNHGIHNANGGHPVGVMSYMDGQIFWQTDGTYGNQAESYGVPWMWDAGGLTTREVPLPTASNYANRLTRPWFSTSVSPLNKSVFDPDHRKVLILPDFSNRSGQSTVCNVSSGVMTDCYAASTTNAPPVMNLPAGAYNHDDGRIYIYGGLPSGTGINSSLVYTYDVVSDVWAVLTTTCSGVDCNGAAPPARNCAGFAYSTRDYKFLMMGGNNAATSCNAGTASFTDTWTFEPSSRTWTELCNNCGYDTVSNTFDKLAYDDYNNVFLYVDQGSNTAVAGPWAFALSTPLNYGRTAASWPSLATSLNRTSPSGISQGNAFDLTASVKGSNLLTAHAETGPPSDGSVCQGPRVFIGSVDATGTRTWFPGGTALADCNAFQFSNDNHQVVHSQPTILVLPNGKYMTIFEKHGWFPLAYIQSQTFSTFYDPSTGKFTGRWGPVIPPGNQTITGINSNAGNPQTVTLASIPDGLQVNDVVVIQGGTGTQEFVNVTAVDTAANTVSFNARRIHSGAWTIADSGFVPCFTTAGVDAQCYALNAPSRIHTYPTGAALAGGKVYVTTVEQHSNLNPREHYVYVAQYDPATNLWTQVGTKLNVNGAKTFATYASPPATDGAGNLAVCFTEAVNFDRSAMTKSPHMYCKLWNGSAWALMGSGSLDHAASSWSYRPAIEWSNGAWYAAWTEQASPTAPVLLYVSRYDAGTNSWSAAGSNPMNVSTTTGLAYHPSLSADGSGALYLAWEEQAAIGQHALGHVKRWSGGGWEQVGGDIAHDLTQGSVAYMNVKVVGGTPYVYFAEATYGNLQQTYVRMWDGTSWQAALSGTSIPQIQSTSPLPGGTTGSAYSFAFVATGVPAATWSGANLPAGSSINSSTGQFSWANPVAGTFSFQVTATNASGADSKTFSLTVAASGVAPVIQDASILPTGTSGTTYSYTFTATGIPAPAWSSSGLPSGATLSTSGVLTWSGPVANTYSFTITAANSLGSDSRTVSLTINANGVFPTITSPAAFSCVQNVPCAIDMDATGTPGPTWSIVAGVLPSGLALSDTAAGTITGIPSAAGVYSVTVRAANGIAPDAIQALVITVSTASANIVTIQERLYPTTMGGAYIAGSTRTSDPVTFGVPFPDDPANGVTSISELGLSGTSAGQFRSMAMWPSGRLKWILIDTLADIAANQTNTAITITGGGGNFGGSNLAIDNGDGTITVSTSAAIFTIKKANFNLIDQVVIGSKVLVQSGASPGLVILGPDPAAGYPANVTCTTDGAAHEGVSSVCDHEYRSSNDASSTVIIEENGPVKSVLKADGDYKDSSGNVYMHFTVRMTFYKGKSAVKVSRALRNADLGTSNTFTTAFKGHWGEEARIMLNTSGTMTFWIGNDTSTPTNGFLSNSTDTVYLYQGLSTFMAKGGTAPPNDCPSAHDGDGYCVLTTPDLGYRIAKNGSNLVTGTSAQIPKGWADISDSTGAGVQIGVYQMAAYGAKSLEFRSGGADTRIGLWASQNSKPYYQAWPQHNISDVWFNFHATAPLDLNADFQKYQLPLVARVERTVYNNAKVFEHTLLDPTEEDAFYTSVGSTAISPLASTKMLALKDSAASGTNSTYQIYAWQYRPWEAGGGGNQMDFSLAKTYNYLTRGFTGGLIDAGHMYRLVSSAGFPRADGFTWRSQATSARDSMGQPTAISANKSMATRDWPATWEHVHIYGMGVYYFLTGDEWVREGLAGPLDQYLQPTVPVPGTERGVGGAFMNITHLAKTYRDVTPPPGNIHLAADTATYNALITQGQGIYAGSVAPDLCVSGYPVGCTNSSNPRGVSRVRGTFYAGSTTIAVGPSTSEPYCGSSGSVRGTASFQASEFLEGLDEFRALAGPSWVKYGESFDLMYGVTQWAFAENYYDNGTGAWGPSTTTYCNAPTSAPIPASTVYSIYNNTGVCGNGYRHYVLLDVPNSCSIFYYPIRAEQTVWHEFATAHAYTGTLSWLQKFKMALQRTAYVGATEEFQNYTIAQTIDRALRPGTVSISAIPITGFTDNGGGSYTIRWNAPVNGVSYAVKWGPKYIVDWIGYDAYNGVFTGNPATTMNWFAATTPPGIPNPGPAGTTQSMTILTGATGLTAANFAIKAYTDSSGAGNQPANQTSTVKTGPVSAIFR